MYRLYNFNSNNMVITHSLNVYFREYLCECGKVAYQSSLPRRIWRVIIESRTAFVAVVRHFTERFPATTAQDD